MNTNPSYQVSIIMPAYNSERFIRQAIESVCSQTFEEWELIVIDDGSTDNTFAIANAFHEKDPRISVYKNPSPVGLPSSPRNYGVQIAKGRFIAFLDSDDYWLPDKLKEQLPLFDNEDTAIVFSNYEKVNEDGKLTGRVVTAPKLLNFNKLLLGNGIGNLTGIYDTKKVGKIRILDIHHEDYMMWLTILKKGFVARNTNTTTGAYRISKASVSSNKMNLISWQWSIYRNILHIPFGKSLYYYANYAVKAWNKRRI